MTFPSLRVTRDLRQLTSSSPSRRLVQKAYKLISLPPVVPFVGEDFDLYQNTVFFNPGVTSQTVSTTVRGDLKHEPDETFFLNLSNPVEATLADAGSSHDTKR